MSTKEARTMQVQSIVILGCGNLAWHLAKGLSSLKTVSVSVCNHAPNLDLKEFRTKLKCKTFDRFDKMPKDANMYIICVGDQHIAATTASIHPANPKAIIVHTSGSMSLEVLRRHVKKVGVLYPLQSFSKNDLVQWAETPILIEGSDGATTKAIQTLAKQLSPHVCLMSSEQRLHMHLSAVLVNNFTNALYAGAQEHLRANKQGVEFKLLLPLIKTGIRKIEQMPAKLAQTGPAKRGDKEVMQKHLGLLKKKSLLKKVYKEMSKLIKEQQDART